MEKEKDEQDEGINGQEKRPSFLGKHRSLLGIAPNSAWIICQIFGSETFINQVTYGAIEFHMMVQRWKSIELLM